MKHYQIMRGVQTRRQYMWQVHCMQAGLMASYALCPRSLSDLEAFVVNVLKQYSDKSVWLYFHRGPTSACYGNKVIFMIPRQYCYAVVLHELTHALGFPWHTPGFMGKYIDLLVSHANCDRGLLEISAGLYGVI